MKSKAKVRVTLSPMLRHLSELRDEPEVWEISAADAFDCLQVLMKRYPSIRKWAYDKEGKLQPVIWFFVNDPKWSRKLTPDEFERPLKEGDEVLIAFGKL